MTLHLAEGKARAQAVDPGIGRAPHSAVTIGDAIGDLRRFHWPQLPDRAVDDGVPLRAADGHGRIGYTTAEGAYEWEPRNAFQAAARRRDPVGDIQHYTRALDAENAKRQVRLRRVRYLPRSHHTYMLHNPMSANAQGGYSKAYFGRLDERAVFLTVTTTVGPNAKQSRCLNPWCRRLVTIRELARAQGFPDHFVFKSVRGEHDTKTMQLQIGNAVAWPVVVALGRELRGAMVGDWVRKREEAELVE
ncbi:S-adenosyl-L-methionine-dependent methyltransferase [Schizophyllum fasciatum]